MKNLQTTNALKQHEKQEEVRSLYEEGDVNVSEQKTHNNDGDLTVVVPPYKLFHYATKYDILMVLLASLGSIVIGVLKPIRMAIFGEFLAHLGVYISKPDQIFDHTIHVILIFVYLGTATLVTAYFTHALWVLSGENQSRRIRQLYIHSILRQDMTWFDKADNGSLTTRLATDTQIIQEGISEKMGQFIQVIAQAVAGFTIAFVRGWQLAIVVLPTVPVIFLLGYAMSRAYPKYAKLVQNSYAQAGSIAEQAFNGIRTVYAFSLQTRFAKSYDDEIKKARAAGSRRGLVIGSQLGVFKFVLVGTYGLALWYGAKLCYEGTLTGDVVLITFYAMNIATTSLLELPRSLGAITSACGAATRIFAIIERIPDIDPDSPEGFIKEDGDQLLGKIEFRNVDFSYPTRPDIQVLKGFSAKVEPGQTIALVGSSGSGKSTTVQLLQRFYNVVGGEILIDDRNIKEYNVQWMRRQVGVVSQEPVLFNMSIRENLLLGVTAQTVTDQEMFEACRKANCHSFISQLPLGYDTSVGQHGCMLSGGQKQRIAIARAILKNPSILLLDEATSALDTQSERIVQRALDAASKNRTTFVIAHRLSTIRNADMIIVMKQGRMVEQGNHEELVNRNGAYADLVRKQEISLEDDLQQQLVDEAGQKESIASVDDDNEYDSTADEKKQEKLNTFDTLKSQQRPSTVTSAPFDTITIEQPNRTEQSRKQKAGKSPFFKVFQEMRSEWHLIGCGTLGGAFAGTVYPISGFLIAMLITLMIDPMVDNIAAGPMTGANLYAFLFLIVALVTASGFFFQTVCFEMAGAHYTERLRSRIFQALMKQEMAFYDDKAHSTGVLTSTLAVDAKNINEIISNICGDVSSMLSTAITGFIIAFAHNWALTLIILVCMPLMIVGSVFKYKAETNFEDDSKKASIQTGEVASEAIRAIRTVALLAKQDYFESKYHEANELPHKLVQRKAYRGSIGFALSECMVQYLYAVAFYSSIRMMAVNMITLKEMMITLMTLVSTANRIGQSSMLTSSIAKARNTANSAFGILERRPAIDLNLEGIEPSSVQGRIECKEVSFRYPGRPDVPIFSGGFNLTALAGKNVALVGPSGCGKSTTIALLERWYDPLDGTVSLDDHNLQRYTVDNLRSHMSLVSQEPILFDFSIGENIRFGVPSNVNVTEDDIIKVCKAANIHSFVTGLPKGYDTRVGDKGSQLSGGQKQRIAIARALLRNPRVLLLDEATSALDSESEKMVQTAIDNVMQEGNRTTITIAHRLSTIQNSDLICVISKGCVVEQGTHWELLRLNGLYSALVREQSLCTTSST